MTPIIAQNEIDALKAAWQNNPNDLGVGLYNPGTREIHVGSFDTVAEKRGHEGLADALGIQDSQDWRGFVVDALGAVTNLSHFNKPDQQLSGNPELIGLFDTKAEFERKKQQGREFMESLVLLLEEEAANLKSVSH